MKEVSDLIVRDLSPAIWEGANCSISEPGERIIRDAGEWEKLWKAAFGGGAPPVDFDKYFALAVFAGACRTGGYGVEFLPPLAEGEKAVLGYRVRAPSPSGFVIQAFTQPYAIQLYHVTPRAVKTRCEKRE